MADATWRREEKGLGFVVFNEGCRKYSPLLVAEADGMPSKGGDEASLRERNFSRRMFDRVCEREEEDGQKDNNWEEGRTQVDHIVSKIHVVIRGVHVA